MRKNIAIIGGGISGLAVAYFLNKAGFDLTLFEAENETGGKIKTLNDKGFIIDLGPNTAIESNPILKDIFIEMGSYEKLLYADEASKNRFILKDKKLHKLPLSPTDFFKSDLFSFKSKIRLMMEPLIPKCKGEITIAEFVRKRLGQELLSYAINPFVAGVYAGNPEKLSLKYAFPKLFQLQDKYRSLVIGAVMTARERKKRKEKVKTEAPIFSFKNGMMSLPFIIQNILKGKIKLNTKVKRVIKKLDRFEIEINEGERIEAGFSDVIISVPAYSASSILMSLSPPLGNALKEIEYPPIAVVITVYREKDVGFKERGFGFLVPEIEKRKILGTLWNSYMFRDRTPEGYLLFTTFIGGARQPELVMKSEAELINIVQQELKEIMQIENEPIYFLVKKWEKAIPQYNQGYEKIIDEIEKFQIKEKGIHFCSNFIGGISLSDCIINAKNMADKIRDMD